MQIDVEGKIPGLVELGAVDGVARADAGIVHQHRDLAGGARDLCGNGGAGAAIGDVEREGPGLATAISDGGRGALGAGGVDVGRDNTRALHGKASRNGGAVALGSACHECEASGKQHGGVLILLSDCRERETNECRCDRSAAPFSPV